MHVTHRDDQSVLNLALVDAVRASGRDYRLGMLNHAMTVQRNSHITGEQTEQLIAYLMSSSRPKFEAAPGAAVGLKRSSIWPIQQDCADLTDAETEMECSTWFRFSECVDAVCQQCPHAQADCGCGLGDANPATDVLREYVA